ncbi:PREDICTED: uncharacterized protein LOC108366875 isoform X5 [Rhagoletis zephyria]|uniref:uncharacterized protein LOC108366875 isoform X5 n=1 Tax=Rhagoletis zephyria TaxID=28612 RepID=UPI0008116284|nr:PREDICTED: uncharacterized protein LOC108366875 isoform X5 [Rhagoletis zephyria]XP_017476847.1 PREDICTED: uncharacterized protein LOC108366875 isoform X5 [Rhagoletis zephyria]XP_017476848.1 PREDICTED: uncharacterized protein LOC108366875 isoform X5 [Rhagoletis zephyria]XP_017476849.1 PREDICTED: uncharacterized protein LOC108366875 isoform X5 [Rhagoletis zephyria]XP_017476851.1 PREDICTED: uncharacterized protein LOC108366875 isoform X5 [Rhagoletis zephyria]
MDIENEYDKYRAELIQQVRDNSILWDKKHHLYYKKAKKNTVWKRLAQRFGKSIKQVREHWISLRIQYRENLRREVVQGAKPRWKLYPQMSFLRDCTIIRNKNKASSDSESDMEITQKHTVANSDKEFKNSDVDEVQLCEVAEQKEADSCIIEEWIKTEIALDEEMKAKNVAFDNDTRTTDQAPEESNIKTTTRQQIMVHIPHTSSTPVRTSLIKRRRVENEECNETEKINAGSQISIRNASELLAVHATEGVECDTNMDNRESQTRKNRWAKEIYIHESPEDDLTNLHEISEDTTTDDCGLQKRYIAAQTHTCVDKQVRDRKECQIDSVDTSTKYLKKKKNKKIKAKRDMQQKDDDYHFVISLLPYLRRGNLERKLQTRMDLMKVVMEGLKCNDE